MLLLAERPNGLSKVAGKEECCQGEHLRVCGCSFFIKHGVALSVVEFRRSRVVAVEQ